jgi:hypothetical protein
MQTFNLSHMMLIKKAPDTLPIKCIKYELIVKSVGEVVDANFFY